MESMCEPVAYPLSLQHLNMHSIWLLNWPLFGTHNQQFWNSTTCFCYLLPAPPNDHVTLLYFKLYRDKPLAYICKKHTWYKNKDTHEETSFYLLTPSEHLIPAINLWDGYYFYILQLRKSKAQIDQVYYPRSHCYLSDKILFLSFYKTLPPQTNSILFSQILVPALQVWPCFLAITGNISSSFSTGHFSRKFSEWAELKKGMWRNQIDCQEGKNG